MAEIEVVMTVGCPVTLVLRVRVPADEVVSVVGASAEPSIAEINEIIGAEAGREG